MVSASPYINIGGRGLRDVPITTRLKDKNKTKG